MQDAACLFLPWLKRPRFFSGEFRYKDGNWRSTECFFTTGNAKVNAASDIFEKIPVKWAQCIKSWR